MKNFIFKSTDADFKKMFSIIETIQKNCLYTTYRLDSLIKEIKTLTTNKDLQTQVDKYFDEDKEDMPEDAESTAEQTQ